MHNESLSPNDPFNQSLKKSILWNAVEPGDPYDIKKSMIAKLPGDKKIFLGNKLEIVCLLQAAQIERLALNLQEYKVKLRQVEKSDLDRHSYEIQIKELASRLQNEESLRNENTKLKNFIDRLNQQLEQNKQRVSVGNSQLNTKYQQALLQIQTITDQNSQLNNEAINIRRLLQGKNAQLSQAETTISELQDQLNKYIEEEGRMSDYEDKFTLLGKEIERLNLVLKGKTSEIQSLKEQISQYEGQIRRQKQENQYLITNQLKLNEEINNYKLQMKKSKHEEDQHKYREYQSRIESSNKEINTLNIRLANERSQFQSQCDRLKSQNDQVRSIIRELQTHIQELEDQNQKYQDNSSIIARQIERLNAVLKSKIDEINSLQSKNNRITQENQFYIQQLSLLEKESAQLKNIHRKMQELEFELSKQQAAKERLAKINSDLLKRQTELDQSTIEQFQIRIGHLTEDIKRYQLTIEQYQVKIHHLNENINAIQNQNKLIKEKANQGEYSQQQLRKVTRELVDLKNLMMQEDINKKNTQERLNDLTKKSMDYQKLINQLSGQIQRLNEILKAKLQETTILENKMQYITGQNHRLQGEIKSRQGIVQDFQNKFALVSLEVQRLNNNMMLKVQQTNEQEQQINSLKKENTKLNTIINQINYKSNQNIQEINEQMRRQLYQKDEELNKLRANQTKFAELLAQWQKLNQIMKQKQQEIKEKDGHLYRLQSECETLKLELRDSKNRQKQISDLQRLNNLLRLKVEEAERWQSSNHELIKNNQIIQTNLDNSMHQINQLKRQLHMAKNENSNLIRELNQYRDKFNQILREFQRLQQMLDAFRKAERQKYVS